MKKLIIFTSVWSLAMKMPGTGLTWHTQPVLSFRLILYSNFYCPLDRFLALPVQKILILSIRGTDATRNEEVQSRARSDGQGQTGSRATQRKSRTTSRETLWSSRLLDSSSLSPANTVC